MVSALRAAILLGGSSTIGVVMLLITSKGLALIVGPAGVGEYALLQSVVDIGSLIAGLGVSVSVVRLLADAINRGDDRAAAAIRRSATLLMVTLGGVAACVVLQSSSTLAERLFGNPGESRAFVPAALAIPATLVGTLGLALLSAYRQVAVIALLRSLGAVLLAIATLGLVRFAGQSALAVGILLTASWLALASMVVLRRLYPAGMAGGSRLGVAQRLVREGAPFAASSLVGTGVQLLIPFLVALRLGTEGAGFYRAATQISAGYLTFIGASLLQDYYPRLTVHQAEPDVLVQLMDQQLLLVMMLTLPVVLLGIAASSVIVPVLYTSAFLPATEILNWSLIGAMIRLPSWTLSFAILARGRMGTYFAVELLAGMVLLVASVLGMEVLGLAGLGIAVMTSYSIYYPAVWVAVRRDLPLTVTRVQAALLGTVALSLVALGATEAGAGTASVVIIGPLAAAWVAFDLRFAARLLARRRARAAVGSQIGA